MNDAVSSGVDLLENERAAYGTDHAELAGLILEAWGLPEIVQDAAALHHWPNVGQRTGGRGPDRMHGGGAHRFRRLRMPPPARGRGLLPPVAEVIGNKHLLEVFATEVNSIECSLM